ncbi:MAG: efflux RND transporter periplasmic adaptor subunit [Acidobacteria bacterium]|nr:MAG: efflux RND transporter periplasmic adaptor subunit [Acidobacteriota bacterium]
MITTEKGRFSQITAVVFAALCAISQTGCTHAESEPPALTPVRTAEVQTISTGSDTRYSANIVPNAQVDLAFKSGGYVVGIRQVRGADGRMRNMDTGDWVSRGTVLALVRQQDYTDRREQARAQLARAQADHEHAKLTYDRISNLYSAQSATKPEFDQAKAQYDSAVAALNNAKAFLAESQTAVDDSSLRAPFDGWVIRRTVDIGSLVGPTSPAFTIADTRSVRAVFGVPDNAMGRIKLGQPLVITTHALAGEFSGRVSAISPAADPKSRVYSVEVTIPNPHNQLKSGMIASLALGGEILPTNVLAVPLSAVIRDPQNPQAFAVLVTDGTGDPVIVRSRTVDLGDAYGNMIQVLGGIKAGERVVTAGSTLVKSGEKVRVMQ